MSDNNLTVNKKYVESVINISFFKEAKKTRRYKFIFTFNVKFLADITKGKNKIENVIYGSQKQRNLQ